MPEIIYLSRFFPFIRNFGFLKVIRKVKIKDNVLLLEGALVVQWKFKLKLKFSSRTPMQISEF